MSRKSLKSVALLHLYLYESSYLETFRMILSFIWLWFAVRLKIGWHRVVCIACATKDTIPNWIIQLRIASCASGRYTKKPRSTNIARIYFPCFYYRIYAQPHAPQQFKNSISAGSMIFRATPRHRSILEHRIVLQDLVLHIHTFIYI